MDEAEAVTLHSSTFKHHADAPTAARSAHARLGAWLDEHPESQVMILVLDINKDETGENPCKVFGNIDIADGINTLVAVYDQYQQANSNATLN
jgi:uncharacterized protein YdeI (YjbR/CyaY-like superfamily)